MDLSLDLNLLCVPKTMSEFLREVSAIRDSSEKSAKLDEYVKRLDDEMRKIDAFKRELPLCMLLLNDAIGRLEEEATQCTEVKDPPVVEEFVPMKRNCEEDGGVTMENDSGNKKDWMSSAKLWNSNINYDYEKRESVSKLKLRSEEEDQSMPENPVQTCYYRNRGVAFVPFKGSSGFQKTTMEEDKEDFQVPGLSLLTPMPELGSINSNSKSNGSSRGGSVSSLFTDRMELQSKPQQQYQPQQQQRAFRKQRRCWSPELHRRFVEALQQLGGSQVATPKQIRELMQVEGLTNDEVKSHLQKYRLHVRKLPASSAGPANCSKANNLHSGSPQGPLLASGSGKGNSSTEDESMEAEEDEISMGHSWKGGLHKPEEV